MVANEVEVKDLVYLFRIHCLLFLEAFVRLYFLLMSLYTNKLQRGECVEKNSIRSRNSPVQGMDCTRKQGVRHAPLTAAPPFPGVKSHLYFCGVRSSHSLQSVPLNSKHMGFPRVLEVHPDKVCADMRLSARSPCHSLLSQSHRPQVDTERYRERSWSPNIQKYGTASSPFTSGKFYPQDKRVTVTSNLPFFKTAMSQLYHK